MQFLACVMCSLLACGLCSLVALRSHPLASLASLPRLALLASGNKKVQVHTFCKPCNQQPEEQIHAQQLYATKRQAFKNRKIKFPHTKVAKSKLCSGNEEHGQISVATVRQKLFTWEMKDEGQNLHFSMALTQEMSLGPEKMKPLELQKV